MPQMQNPTAAGDRVSRKSLVGASAKFDSPIRTALQLPPIIAQHLWRPDELLAIEAAAMIAVALFGGPTHG